MNRKKVGYFSPNPTDGIKCHVCGCRHFSEVLKTEPIGNCIRRLRKCRNCGTAFHTFESR